MKRIIDIPEEVYNYIMRLNSCNMAEEYIKNSTPLETVTEFADRCRECGARYGKLLKQEQTDTWSIKEVADALARHLPIVTPQPKTGHWIFKQFDEETGISNNYWCSECGKPLAQVYKTYCSNCGAKMESEEV